MILVPADPAGLTPAAAAVPLVVLLLTAPPGLLLRRAAGAPELGLAGALALGLGWAAGLAFAAGVLGLPLAVAATAMVVSSVLSVVALWRAGGPGLGRPGRPEATIALLGLAIACLAAWQGPWLSHTADVFYHLAAVRSVLLKGEAFPTQPMYPGSAGWPDPTSSGLHTLLALAGGVLDVDAVPAWRAFHPLAAVLPALGLARFAWVATGRPAAAWLALGLHLLVFGGLDLRTAAYPSHLGMALFWAVLARSILPGAAPALATAVGLIGLAAIHLALATAALTAIAVVALCRLASCRCAGAAQLLPGLAAGAIAIAARSAPLALAVPVADPRVGTPAYPATAPPVGGPVTGPLLSTLLGAAVVPPPPVLVATVVALAALALWPRLRGWPSAPAFGLVVAASFVPFAAAASSLASSYTPAGYALVRTSLILAAMHPVLLSWALLGLGAVALGSRSIAGQADRRAGWLGRILAASGVAVLLWSCLGGAVATLGPLLGPATPGAHSLAGSRAGDLSRAWSARVAALAALPRGAAVTAHPETAYQLAGLADVFVAATPRSHTPAAVERAGGWLRRGDVLDLLDLSAEPARLASIAEHMADGYLLVDTTSPTWPTWRDRPPAAFERKASGPDWILFRYDRSGLAGLVEVPLVGEVDGLRWGVQPVEPLAGEVAFVRLDGASADGSGQVALRHGASGRVVASAVAGRGISALHVAADAPVGWYDLLLVAPGRAPVVLATVPLGHEYEAESLPIPDLPESERQPAGWALYEQSFYGRHAAARASTPAAAARPIPTLPPGRYSVRARVYEYVYAEPNQIEVRFGNGAVGLGWASGSDAPRIISNEFATTAPARELELAVVRRGQPLVVVDWLRIYPAGPPPG